MHNNDKLFTKLEKLQRLNASQVRLVAKKLKLSLIKTNSPEAPALNMDDYLKFVMFNLKHSSVKKLSKKELKSRIVNVPFKIKN